MMPTQDSENPGGYPLDPSVANEMLSHRAFRGPSLMSFGMVDEERLKALDDKLTVLLKENRQIKALLWQLVLAQKGVHVELQPDDAETLVDAAGLILKRG